MLGLQAFDDRLLEIFEPVHSLCHHLAIDTFRLGDLDGVVADARYGCLGWALPAFPRRPQGSEWRAAGLIRPNKPDFDRLLVVVVLVAKHETGVVFAEAEEVKRFQIPDPAAEEPVQEGLPLHPAHV